MAPQLLSSLLGSPSFCPMDYPPSSPVDTLALGDLSLSVFDSPECSSRCPSIQSDGNAFHYAVSERGLSSSGEYQSRWSVPAWQVLDSSPYSYTSQMDISPDMLPPHGSAPAFKDDGNLFLPYIPMPELEFPPSPSDTCSSVSTDFSSHSPRPESLHVICNVPLLAPVPLPYHSPTFLQFDLPDVDEDLSHPPYTQRCSSAKRKRDPDDHAINDRSMQKRRSENVPKSIRPVSKHNPPGAGNQIRIRQYVVRH